MTRLRRGRAPAEFAQVTRVGVAAVDAPLVGEDRDDAEPVVAGRVDHFLGPWAAVVLDFDPARWLEHVGVLAYGEAVANKWGQLQARAQRPGRPQPRNDTWIAACCLVDDLPLTALNTKDFGDFAEHEGLALI